MKHTFKSYPASVRPHLKHATHRRERHAFKTNPESEFTYCKPVRWNPQHSYSFTIEHETVRPEFSMTYEQQKDVDSVLFWSRLFCALVVGPAIGALFVIAAIVLYKLTH